MITARSTSHIRPIRRQSTASRPGPGSGPGRCRFFVRRAASLAHPADLGCHIQDRDQQHAQPSRSTASAAWLILGCHRITVRPRRRKSRRSLAGARAAPGTRPARQNRADSHRPPRQFRTGRRTARRTGSRSRRTNPRDAPLRAATPARSGPATPRSRARWRFRFPCIRMPHRTQYIGPQPIDRLRPPVSVQRLQMVVPPGTDRICRR